MIKAINTSKIQNNNYKSKDQVSFKAGGGSGAEFNRALNKLRVTYKDVNWGSIRDNLSPADIKLLGKALKMLQSVKKKMSNIEFPIVESKWPRKTLKRNHELTGKERLKVEIMNQKIVTIEQTAVFKKPSEIGPKRKKIFYFADGETPDMYTDHLGSVSFKK